MPKNNTLKESSLGRAPLDPDLPFLSQLEELALSDDQGLEWLTQNIYPDPEIMSLSGSTILTRTKSLPPTSPSTGSQREAKPSSSAMAPA